MLLWQNSETLIRCRGESAPFQARLQLGLTYKGLEVWLKYVEPPLVGVAVADEYLIAHRDVFSTT